MNEPLFPGSEANLFQLKNQSPSKKTRKQFLKNNRKWKNPKKK